MIGRTIARARMAMLALAALATLSLVRAQEEAPRRVLRDATIETVRDRFGRTPIELLAARADGEELPAAWLDERPEELDEAFWETVLCGLWSDEPKIAYAAAGLVEEQMLDLRDIDRFVEITMPHLADEELRFSWDTFKHVLDVDRVTEVLLLEPAWNSEVRSFFMNDLHRSLRPEHLPVLAQRVNDDDPVVRAQAFRWIAWVSHYTDRQREVVAATLAKWPGSGAFVVYDYDDPSTNRPYRPRPLELGTDNGGYPPLLRAALARWFLEEPDRVDNVSFDGWLLRWAADVSPAPGDGDLLLELLRSPERYARWIAVRGAAALPSLGDELRAALAAHAADAETEEDERYWAMAALSEHDAIRDAARASATALAVALETDLDAAFAAWSRRALGPDTATGHRAIELLVDAIELADYGPHRIPEAVRERLRAALETAAPDLDFARLHLVARELPACRTPALADAYLARLGPEDVATWAAAMLEVHDEDALRARLTAWARDDGDPDRDAALALLARLGAPELGELLVDWAQRTDADPFVLARSGASTAVRARLLRACAGVTDPTSDGAGPALAALGMTQGLPEASCRGWAGELAGAPPVIAREGWDRWRTQTENGDALGALLDLLAALPAKDAWFRELGLVRDPSVVAALHRARAVPGVSVRAVIGELALAGDPDARAELAEVRERRLYGWMDDATAPVRTLGPSLELMPYWIGEIETICCRRNGAAWAIEELTGFDTHDMNESGLLTQHDHAAAWWARVGPHLRWSRIADRFVVAPH